MFMEAQMQFIISYRQLVPLPPDNRAVFDDVLSVVDGSIKAALSYTDRHTLAACSAVPYRNPHADKYLL